MYVCMYVYVYLLLKDINSLFIVYLFSIVVLCAVLETQFHLNVSLFRGV